MPAGESVKTFGQRIGEIIVGIFKWGFIIFGGIIGVLASIHGAQGLAETFSIMLHQFLYVIGPWAVILSALIGILGGLYMYKQNRQNSKRILSIIHRQSRNILFQNKCFIVMF